jgi:hypothetical protein
VRWVALVVLLAASTAHADDYDAAMARAAAAKEHALDDNNAAAWLETYRLFDEADRIRSTPESKYELANAAAKLKADDVAFEAYEDAIALGLTGPALDKASAFVTDVGSKVGRLRVVGPAGGEVVIAGRARGQLPLARSLVVFAGNARVSLRSDHATLEKQALVVAGSESVVDFTPPKPLPVETPRPVVTVVDRSPGVTLTAIGGATLVAGIVGYIVAQATIDARRRSLDSTCIGERQPDYCVTTDDAYRPFAQSDGDAIASYKVVRGASVVTAIVGAGITTLGVTKLLSPPRVTVTAQSFTVSLGVTF